MSIWYCKEKMHARNSKGTWKKHGEEGENGLDLPHIHPWRCFVWPLLSANVCPPSFPSRTTQSRRGFLFFFHVDEKGRSVLAIPLQFWFDALLKGDNISLLKGRGVISEDIMKVSVREGMLRRSWSSGSSKPLLLLIPRLTIYPYEACRYRSFAISPESCLMELPEEWYGSASVAPSACWNSFRGRLMSKATRSLFASPQWHLVGYGLQTGLMGFSYADTG